MSELNFSQQDQSFMNFALNLSKKNIGLTASNPSVGCVIVKNNIIISTGITGENGVPHAESIAISKAGDDANGATIYVTLEPCSHFGKTPPCADLIINSKISRVVVAVLDPDKRVNGTGIKKLQEAKIQVDVGLMADRAQEINRGFFSARTKSRPFITLKLATSFDGKIAKKDNSDRWISNEISRNYAHFLRAKNDAILVGAGTVNIDDPMLDCRINGLSNHSPQRIILSSKLNIDVNKKIANSAKSIQTYIATDNSDVKKFTDLGIKIINFEKNNLQDFVKKLPELGINNLLVEGGSVVVAEFLKANLIDELIHIKSPRIIGEDGASVNINQIVKQFKIAKSRKILDDWVTNFSN